MPTDATPRPNPPRTAAGWAHTAGLAAVLAAAALLASPAARADERTPSATNPTSPPAAWRVECAACHLAYPPSLLPARSWQRLMQGLGSHFGTDASIDAKDVAQIQAWLVANAGRGRRAAEEPPQDRITRSAWFEHEHRKLGPDIWRLPSVKSAANCGACHTQADAGRFDEHALRMPEGLTAAQRRAFAD